MECTEGGKHPGLKHRRKQYRGNVGNDEHSVLYFPKDGHQKGHKEAETDVSGVHQKGQVGIVYTALVTGTPQTVGGLEDKVVFLAGKTTAYHGVLLHQFPGVLPGKDSPGTRFEVFDSEIFLKSQTDDDIFQLDIVNQQGRNRDEHHRKDEPAGDRASQSLIKEHEKGEGEDRVPGRAQQQRKHNHKPGIGPVGSGQFGGVFENDEGNGRHQGNKDAHAVRIAQQAIESGTTITHDHRCNREEQQAYEQYQVAEVHDVLEQRKTVLLETKPDVVQTYKIEQRKGDGLVDRQLQDRIEGEGQDRDKQKRKEIDEVFADLIHPPSQFIDGPGRQNDQHFDPHVFDELQIRNPAVAQNQEGHKHEDNHIVAAFANEIQATQSNDQITGWTNDDPSDQKNRKKSREKLLVSLNKT